MTSTATLYGYTMAVLFAVMFVGTLTGKRVISLTVERHVDYSNSGHQLQCSRPSAEDSHQAEEARA